MLEIAKERVIDAIGAAILSLELVDAVFALSACFVKELLCALLEQLVRLGARDGRQRGRVDRRVAVPLDLGL
ncbi:MAG: hypothetical protein ACYDCA_01420 [Candidatus Tyrphobacter sp.]